MAVQVAVFAAELALLGASLWLPGHAVAITALVLFADLMLVSPLKAGRAFFFETLTADGDAAAFSLLWRYYRHGYLRTVGWRALVWGERLLWSVPLYTPALFLFACSRVIGDAAVTQTDTIVAMACFAFGLLFTVCAFVAVEILLLRLLPIPYLLSHTGSLRQAVTLSRRIVRKRLGVPVLLYLEFFWFSALGCLILPWPFTSPLLQTAKADTVHRLLRHFPAENASHLLQRRKKCDRMFW